jgi:glutaredoxin
LFVVLLGLIGVAALYVLSGGQPDDSGVSNVTTTLKQMTSRVVSGADGEQAAGTEEDSEGGGLGLARWFGRGDPGEGGSFKDVYYQYVDDTGTVHFVQNLSEVPAQWQSRAGRIEVERSFPVPGRGSPPAAASRRAEARKPAEKPYAYQPDPEVVVYTTAWCGWCQKTLRFLDDRGVRYVNKDIEANDWNREELIEITGRTSIPVVVIDGEVIRGYNAARMEQLLGSG